MRDKNKLVIWPVYIDRNRSRSQGRIISKKSSIAEPTLIEIEKAALKLGLNPEVEKDKSYPKSWWEKSGRVLIDNSAPKTQLSRKIATAIKEIRSK
ncbi:signal recognition particle protein Srp19 [uncultured Methanomethylovorans sp.]|uniref:signal recognition particle protein Srp19 n=1 Tax=uncultured Methanomethylovorans sp. TaxID=183759 RepID=UPI002AA7FF3F|nr:signal recognition particle protein Srp19 [uncultured Methanomethylovorans sp.]